MTCGSIHVTDRHTIELLLYNSATDIDTRCKSIICIKPNGNVWTVRVIISLSERALHPVEFDRCYTG